MGSQHSEKKVLISDFSLDLYFFDQWELYLALVAQGQLRIRVPYPQQHTVCDELDATQSLQGNKGMKIKVPASDFVPCLCFLFVFIPDLDALLRQESSEEEFPDDEILIMLRSTSLPPTLERAPQSPSRRSEESFIAPFVQKMI